MRCLALATLLLATPATAQEAPQDEPPNAAADDEPPEYGAVIDAALEEYAAGRWTEARALFDRAHAIFPNARTLRGAGMAAFELREYSDALRSLRAALASDRRALTTEQRAQVERLVERAATFVGQYTIGPIEGAAQLRVDGIPMQPEVRQGASHFTVVLDAGPHEIELADDLGRTGTLQLRVRGGESETLTIPLAEPSASGGGGAPVVVTTPGPDAGPFVLMVAGGVVVVGGAVLLGLGIADGDRVSGAPAGTEWSDVAEAFDRAPILGGIGAGGIGAGALMAAAGALWLAFAPATETTVVASTGGLALRGRF